MEQALKIYFSWQKDFEIEGIICIYILNDGSSELIDVINSIKTKTGTFLATLVHKGMKTRFEKKDQKPKIATNRDESSFVIYEKVFRIKLKSMGMFFV